jgi:predicted nucleotidyltransferase
VATDDNAASIERVGQVLTAMAVPGVVSAYVFGSVASGRAHAESDLDLGVLLDRQTYPDVRARFEAQLELRRHLSPATVGREVDLVVLNDVSPVLGRRIVASGLRVFCPDGPADHAFRRDVQSRAADLDPFLRRTRQTLLAGLSR